MHDTKDDMEDLDAALASIDIDEDFMEHDDEITAMEHDSEDDNDDKELSKGNEEDRDSYFQRQLQRPEVFSHRYRPDKDEEADIQKLSDFLNMRSKSGWNGGSKTVHQLLNHEGDLKNIILQRGNVILPDGTARELILLTHGFILAKLSGGLFTSAFDVAELFDNVVYVKDLWMTASNSSFALRMSNNKEIILSSERKQDWLNALERVLLQNRLHSKSKDETRDFGWQYQLVQTSIFTSAVTGAAFFAKAHLEKVNYLDDYSKMAPLHYAAMHNNAHTVEALLEYGADPEIKDGDGRTPMYYAQRDQHTLVEEALRQHGALDSYLLDQEINGELAANVAYFEGERAANEEAMKKEELFAGADIPVDEAAAPGSKKALFASAFSRLAAEEVHHGKKEQVQHNATTARSQMAENMRLINERGDKINELGDKANKLEDNAMEFASLASQLKEKLKKENDKLSFPFGLPKVSVPRSFSGKKR